jgi:hypothetical protein
LTIINRTADATQRILWQILHRKSEGDAVWLRQMRLERPLVFPDVDYEGMVRRDEPINNAKALIAKISLARVTIWKQCAYVGNLLRIER